MSPVLDELEEIVREHIKMTLVEICCGTTDILILDNIELGLQVKEILIVCEFAQLTIQK